MIGPFIVMYVSKEIESVEMYAKITCSFYFSTLCVQSQLDLKINVVVVLTVVAMVLFLIFLTT